ncbi:MAG TPA: BON domain-containing protein [Terriglobia bacterium]|nr:BON domain-containing protein [Terriglobia bacterium]
MKTNRMRISPLLMIFTGLLVTLPMLAFGDVRGSGRVDPPNPNMTLSHQVRHELLMLPYYGVFDNLEYKVDGNNVELSGQVIDPTLRSEAGNVVKDIKGIKSVTNKIQILPLSPNDNRIRFAEYRAVFGFGGLYRYAMGANPSIHIIVDNGNVTLVGVVGNKMDKTLAGMAANWVPDVFSVTNNLRVS